jgi:class 3 adenylate cyclase
MRLRFKDRELEKSYLVRHYNELSRLLIVVFGVVLLGVVTVIAVNMFIAPERLGGVDRIFLVAMLAAMSTLAVISRLKGAWLKYLSPVGLIPCAVFGWYAVATIIAAGDYFRPINLGTALIVVIGAYAIVQERLVWNVAYALTISSIILWGLKDFDGLSAREHKVFIVQNIIVHLIGFAISFIREHKDRRIFSLSQKLEVEKARSDELISLMLPHSIATRLHQGENGISDTYPDATIIFSDLVGFSAYVARSSPQELLRVLNDFFQMTDVIVAKHGGEKIKTIGDSYLVAVGCPDRRSDDAVVAVSLALEMQSAAKKFFVAEGLPLDLRIGIHSGMLVAGVLGNTKPTFDVWGDTVNVAARLESATDPGTILVSQATWEMTHLQFKYDAKVTREFRGVGVVQTYQISQAA